MAGASGSCSPGPEVGPRPREAARCHSTDTYAPVAVAAHYAALIGMTARRRVPARAWREDGRRPGPLLPAGHAPAFGPVGRLRPAHAGVGPPPDPRPPTWPRRLWVEASLLLGMRGNFTGITRTVVSLIQAFLRRPGCRSFCRYDGAGSVRGGRAGGGGGAAGGRPGFRPPEAADLSAPAIDAHPDDVLFRPS